MAVTARPPPTRSMSFGTRLSCHWPPSATRRRSFPTGLVQAADVRAGHRRPEQRRTKDLVAADPVRRTSGVGERAAAFQEGAADRVAHLGVAVDAARNGLTKPAAGVSADDVQQELGRPDGEVA